MITTKHTTYLFSSYKKFSDLKSLWPFPGELLDGDNAYFCEKCQEKRSAIKRMCIRQLPKTLVIQLKRFHYDYETNRAVKFDDHFEFPRLLDMGPYTTEGRVTTVLENCTAPPLVIIK